MTKVPKTHFLSSGEENEEGIPWNEFHVYLDEKGKEIVDILPDGLCYFLAVQNCLGVQYSEKYFTKEIEARIVREISL